MNGVNNHSELEEAIIYQGVKAVLYGETIIDNNVIMDIYNEEMDIAENEKMGDMMTLLSEAGFHSGDVAKLNSYLKVNNV